MKELLRGSLDRPHRVCFHLNSLTDESPGGSATPKSPVSEAMTTLISHNIKPTGKVNNIDCLVTVAPVTGWDILGVNSHLLKLM